VAVEPNCSIAKSVLARMTTDAAERKTLIAEIQSAIDSVDGGGRLILDPYLKTLLLIGARDTGESLGEDFRSDLSRMAISNYRSFLDRYPDEWAVRVEYVEWIHAAHGPEEALAKIREMAVNDPTDSYRFSYFPAYFYAELGDYEHAIKLAREFVQQLGPGDWPQEHYIFAFIAYERGDYAEANVSIKHALLLDPRHLIAGRLSKKIDTALATEHLPHAPEDG
ncbi:MAG: tetratricopeptide (TPR) repeat protein, partial [Glaciecola sp.]